LEKNVAPENVAPKRMLPLMLPLMSPHKSLYYKELAYKSYILTFFYIDHIDQAVRRYIYSLNACARLSARIYRDFLSNVAPLGPNSLQHKDLRSNILIFRNVALKSPFFEGWEVKSA